MPVPHLDQSNAPSEGPRGLDLMVVAMETVLREPKAMEA